MSKIKLLNNQGDEVTIEHSNTSSKQGNSVINIKDITKQVDTIVDLKALDGTHKLVYVTGYHTKGDGAFGSHFFEWDATSTEADNGGTIIKLTNVDTGRYKLKYDGSVNVKWFGVKGDYVLANGTLNPHQTDDTQAIQNAINSVSINLSSNGTLIDNAKIILIPKGVYLVSNICIHNNVTIKGEGKTNTIIKANGTSGSTFYSTKFTGGTRSYSTNIESLTIIGEPSLRFISGSNATLPTVGGIDISSSIGCYIKNVNVYYLDGIALNLDTTQDSSFIFVEALHCTKGVNIGKYDNDISNALHFSHTRVENCSNYLLNINGKDAQVRDVTFSDCKFESGDIKIQSCNGIIFDGCSFMSALANDYMIKIVDGLIADTRCIVFNSNLFTSSLYQTTRAISSTITTEPVVITDNVISTLGSPVFYGNVYTENNAFFDCNSPVIELTSGGEAINNIVKVATYNTISANEVDGIYGDVNRNYNYSNIQIFNVTSGTIVDYTGLSGNDIFKNQNSFPITVTGLFKILYDAGGASISVVTRLGNSQSVLQDSSVFNINSNENTNGTSVPCTICVPAGAYFSFFSTSVDAVALSGGSITPVS